MKRRNVECGKLRRPLKRNKLTEGIYGSTLLYLKFLLLWAMVILADFILEFRFEFLWPFWLLLRSVYDSFKYQGLAFSVFFICIALTSDMICFFFIPVHWLFFAASTYVWVQYVWHTDKGVCLPTVMLWLLFLYIEAAVRLRDLRHMPFHLDLCRPFAAHCIGYPVVTLGFGFKSYVGYRMRQRKQKDVAKENEFYLQLLQQALPLEQQAMSMQQIQSQVQSQTQQVTASLEQHVKTQAHKLSPQYNPSPEKSRGKGNNNSIETNVQNGGVHNSSQVTSQTQSATTKSTHRKSLDKSEKQEEQHNKHNVSNNSPSDKSDKRFIHSNGSTVSHSDIQLIERLGSVNDFDVNEVEKDKSIKGCGHTTIKSQTNGSVTGKWNNVKESRDSSSTTNAQRERKTRQVKNTSDITAEQQKQQDDYYQRLLVCRRLEADIKRLKSDLQSSRQMEQELRSQVNVLLNGERQAKGDIQQLQHDNDQLQSKLHGLVTARQLDKQTMTSLEKRVAEERKQRSACEASLLSERRARRAAEEARSAIPPPPPPLIRQECTDACKSRRSQMEQDLKSLRRELKLKEERCNALENDAARFKENHRECEILLSALNALQDKNAHLENSLSAETRIKLDLFSALGEVKRQLEIREGLIRSQEKEIEMLKTKIAQDLAVMPQDTFGPAPTCATSKLRLNSEVRVAGTKIRSNESPGCTVSNLDPNATAYTPKSSLVASTEA
ncbi:macoilin-1-like isoform X1 [Temnothorax curvispinosus]|uniref:Macoilin n=2 Tax=Temnothorax curvispinosus TaxID=300111 RepID=A0A6J1PHV5_9HYME|nr:macoilin-1-like isoform X1 [Temnothorax curvispinosus]XP_024875160.1 macoilin-1-like isoform X1 [Temnothorax curvispinosus]